MLRRLWFLIILLLAGPGRADPLDKVSGTEDWSRAAPENAEAEWKDWYLGRVEWRRVGRELRAERMVNQSLARLLLRSGSPGLEEVRRVLQAAPAPTAPESAEPAPRRPKARLRARPSPRPQSAPPPGPGQGGSSVDSDSDALGFETVPVEKLDGTGQAIDEEGNRELQRLTRPRRGQPPAPARRKNAP